MGRRLPASLAAAPKKPRAMELSCSVEYLSHPLEVDSACKRLLHSSVKLLGFDMEWRILYTEGVGPKDIALIQLCYELPEHSQVQSTTVQQNGTGRLQPRSMNVQHQPLQPSPLAPRNLERQNTFQQQVEGVCARKSHCLLLHVSKCGFPDALRSVLESTRITKAGVGIRNDCEKLWLDKRCKLSGCLDINAEFNARHLPCGSRLSEYTSFTLAESCERLLGRSLPKPQGTRRAPRHPPAMDGPTP